MAQLTWMILLVAVVFLRDALGKSMDRVTCGSVIKLYNDKSDVRLHSHDVKYGSGSGQQSVTGVDDVDDVNSHWALRGLMDQPCQRGQPYKCGDVVRFEHVTTSCLLHSHLFSSPLSHNQEVSCFGKGGDGDTGDYWLVQCDGDYWLRGEDVRFKHRDTETYLACSGNKFGRPINGQKEICTVASPSGQTHWKTSEGVYIQPTSS